MFTFVRRLGTVMDSDRISRRRVLGSLGATGVIALAGCVGGDDDDDGEHEPEESEGRDEFDRRLVADDGDGTVTVTSDTQFRTETFSGDGSTTSFSFPHGLNSAPTVWSTEAVSPDAAIPSYSEADATNITVFYDAAPPSGTDNIVFNYFAQPQ